MHVYLRLILLPLFAFNMLLAKTPTQAITTISTYAHDGMMLPVLNDYEDVGIINIGTHNIESINEKIKRLTSSELDTKINIELLSSHPLINNDFTVTTDAGSTALILTANTDMITRIFIRIHAEDSTEIMSKSITTLFDTTTTFLLFDTVNDMEYHVIRHEKWKNIAKTYDVPINDPDPRVRSMNLI